jgi:very-short-patch-repair endonuclease
LKSARQLRRIPTPAEALLWERLRGHRGGGFKFRRQQPLGPYIADFFCARAKLVVEVDGAIHGQREDYDLERTARLEAGGLRVLRFPNGAVLAAPDRVVAEIVRVCRERAG